MASCMARTSATRFWSIRAAIKNAMLKVVAVMTNANRYLCHPDCIGLSQPAGIARKRRIPHGTHEPHGAKEAKHHKVGDERHGPELHASAHALAVVYDHQRNHDNREREKSQRIKREEKPVERGKRERKTHRYPRRVEVERGAHKRREKCVEEVKPAVNTGDKNKETRRERKQPQVAEARVKEKMRVVP